MSSRDYLVYCLRSTVGKRTYVGCTNNWARRLRQHNGELVGGARYTRGQMWEPVYHVLGLQHTEALQLEWALKRRRVRGRAGVKGRLLTLDKMMNGVDRWTKRAPALADIRRHLRIHFFKSRED